MDKYAGAENLFRSLIQKRHVFFCYSFFLVYSLDAIYASSLYVSPIRGLIRPVLFIDFSYCFRLWYPEICKSEEFCSIDYIDTWYPL